MSDHQHLHDAFAEYERRADAIGAARGSAPATRPARETRGPLLLIAASVVLVLAIAGGVVWLAGGSGSGGSKQPAGDAPDAPTSSSAAVSSSAPTPTSVRTSATAPAPSSAPVSTATPHVILPSGSKVRPGAPTAVVVPPPSTPPVTATSTPTAPGRLVVGTRQRPADGTRTDRRALGATPRRSRSTEHARELHHRCADRDVSDR